MKTPSLNLSLRLVALLATAVPMANLEAAEWESLFNGRDFSEWDKYVAVPPGAKTPLGWNNDSLNLFTVVTEDGAPAIRVSGEAYGSITTKSQFTNFHARLEMKWGPKRWPPRAHVGRDSGLLYCAVGEVNPGTGWLTSVENNIMEKGTGQWWSVNGAVIDTEGEWITDANEPWVPYKREGKGERNIVYRPGGTRLTATSANGITPEVDWEQVFGNWNTVEVIFWAGNCIHLLNGHVNLVATLPRYKDQEGRVIPLLHGKLQLQSEGAELFYRNVQVRPIDEIPTEHLARLPSFALNDEGFTPLLVAEALKQWKQSGPGSFEVKDGVASAKGGMGLWWFAGKQFKNFILRGEFNQSGAIADSGVFVRFPDPGNDPWLAVKQGHEMEIGDPHPDKPTWRTGSMYPSKASTKANTKAPGEWNQFELTGIGHNYSVRMNGELVTTWSDPEGRSLEGFIGLQNYDDGMTVSHRNLRIKELP